MDVHLLFFDDCPSWLVADERLRAALDQTGHEDVVVVHELVTTIDEAQRRHFTGSPTILINGVDPFANPGAELALACRVYPSAEGLDGSPSIEQIVQAIGDAAA